MGRGGDNESDDPSALGDLRVPCRVPGYRGFIPGEQQYVVQLCHAVRARAVAEARVRALSRRLCSRSTVCLEKDKQLPPARAR